MLTTDMMTILPELVLTVYAMAALMWGVFMGKDETARSLFILTVAVMFGLGLWIALRNPGEATAFNGAFVADGFSVFAKVAILWSGAAILLMSREYFARLGLMKFEFPVLIPLATVGMMMMVSAGDLMSLYMGLELQSLSLYVVAAIRRDHLKSTEAGLKYFVLGAISSGLLLYGASLVYGFAGTTQFENIAAIIGAEGVSLGLLFGLVFMVTGMAFKVSAVPFHMWTPDVYEGSPTPVTAFFATAPKVAAAVMFARVLFDAFGHAIPDWQQIVALLSALSMMLGAIAAINQRNIKRLMAFSSIGHMGFALMGLAAGTEAGAQALLIYLAIYVTMNIGVFAFILNMRKDEVPINDIYALGMYSRREPGRAFALAILMFSLAGIPPLVGFFGKFYVLTAAIDAGLIYLAVAGVVASVISAFYYLRIIFVMYFGDASEQLNGRMPFADWLLLAGSAAAMVVGVVNMFGVEAMAAAAAATLF